MNEYRHEIYVPHLSDIGMLHMLMEKDVNDERLTDEEEARLKDLRFKYQKYYNNHIDAMIKRRKSR
jgi:uncharacterized FlgJ-related protein